MTKTTSKTTLTAALAAVSLTALCGCAAAENPNGCALPALLDLNAHAEGANPTGKRGDVGSQVRVADVVVTDGTSAYVGEGRSETGACGQAEVLETASSASYAVGERTQARTRMDFDVAGGEVTMQIEPGRIGLVPIHAEVCNLADIARCPVVPGYAGMIGNGGLAELIYTIEADGRVVVQIPITVEMMPGGRINANTRHAEQTLRGFRRVRARGVGVMFEWDRTSVPVAALEEISVSMRTTANSDAFCDRNVCLAAIAEAADPPRGGIKLDVPKTRSLSVATPEPAEGRGGVTLGIPD